MNTNPMKKSSQKAAQFLKTLAHPERLWVLCQLVTGECAAGDLLTASDLSQSALSQHLAKLREEKLVKTRKEAQIVFYRLADKKVESILKVLHQFYCK